VLDSQRNGFRTGSYAEFGEDIAEVELNGLAETPS